MLKKYNQIKNEMIFFKNLLGKTCVKYALNYIPLMVKKQVEGLHSQRSIFRHAYFS